MKFNTTVNPNAFPIQKGEDNIYHPGMSLLDYFAGQALPFFLGAPDKSNDEGLDPVTVSVKCAYAVASAMLAERIQYVGHE